jgi:uncharacterized membrane protein YeiB
MTVVTTEKITDAARVMGVDIARGLALFGMMAVHSFDWFRDDGTPSPAIVIAGGRSAATFVFLAGVSLAFLSGGRTTLQGPRRTAAAAGIAVRALLIGLIGLALGSLRAPDADVILPYYALMFLLAIPLLGLSSVNLARVATGVALLGPVLLVATAGWSLPYRGYQGGDPTIGTLIHDPVGLLALLFITGAYPIVAYLTYLFAGLAIGRLDLSSRRVACWLLGGGLTLAIAARIGSAILLYPMGGLERLIAVTKSTQHSVPLAQQLLWEPTQGRSWWYLALPSPHANTPFDLFHTLGSAMAVVGAVLLLTRIPVAARALRPVAYVGSMTLTLYSAHLAMLASGALADNPPALYLVMVVVATAFALVWRRRFGQGPLERLVATGAGRTRRAVAKQLDTRMARQGPGGVPRREAEDRLTR